MAKQTFVVCNIFNVMFVGANEFVLVAIELYDEEIIIKAVSPMYVVRRPTLPQLLKVELLDRKDDWAVIKLPEVGEETYKVNTDMLTLAKYVIMSDKVDALKEFNN